MPKGSKNAEWWKNHEQLGHLFEKALRPLQDVHHNFKQRDIVGILRQLDVGIIDKGEAHVRAFVEIQKRTEKVGLKDFGQWIYKMKTLPARELVALSEAGFTAPVVKHVKELHPDTVRLARIYEVNDCSFKVPETTFMGITPVEQRWAFVGVFGQTENNEIVLINESGPDCEAKIFHDPAANIPVSPMDIVRTMNQRWVQGGAEPFWRQNEFHNLVLDLPNRLEWRDRTLKTLMMCIECRREITDAETSFFAYDEEFPVKNRRGACCVSNCFIGCRRATITLVFIPTTNDVRLSGQVAFHE